MRQLSDFQKFVLFRIAEQMRITPEFCLHDLVKETITHKDVSSFPDNLVHETYGALADFLGEKNLLLERREKRVFFLTERGYDLLMSDKINALMNDGDEIL